MPLWDEDYLGQPTSGYPGAISGEVAAVSDWKTQQGSANFGLTENTQIISFPTAVNPASAFVRLTNITAMSGGKSTGNTGSAFNDDHGVSINSFDANGFTAQREAGGENYDVAINWEAVEGPFTTLFHDEVTLGDTSSSAVTTISPTTIGQVVAIVCAVRNSGTSYKPQFNTLTAHIENTNDLTVRRNVATKTTVATVAAIEFLPAYTVASYSHTFTNAGAVEVEAITDVGDVTDCLVFPSFSSGSGGNIADASAIAYLSANNTTQLKHYLAPLNGAPTGCTMNTFIVTNTELDVEHINSVTGAGSQLGTGAASPYSANLAVTAVADLGKAILGFNAVVNLIDSNGSQAQVNGLLDAVDRVKVWRAEHGGTIDYAVQVGNLGGVATVITATDDEYAVNTNANIRVILPVLSNDIYTGAKELRVNALYDLTAVAVESIHICDENGNTSTAADQVATHVLFNNPLRRRGTATFGYTISDDNGVTESNTATVSVNLFSRGLAQATLQYNIGGGVSVLNG
jgi:hypothetical protein